MFPDGAVTHLQRNDLWYL